MVVDVAVEVVAGDVNEWGALTVIVRGVLRGRCERAEGQGFVLSEAEQSVTLFADSQD